MLWTNEAARSGTSVIAINGKSQWSAPKGMKLGLPLAALEKANGKPFKMSGFGADGTAGVAGWEGGALGSLPGGCKIGMRLAADPKAPQEARSAVAGDKEFLSSDAERARAQTDGRGNPDRLLTGSRAAYAASPARSISAAFKQVR